MRIKLKLALSMSLVIFIAIVPVSIYIIKSQENARLINARETGLEQTDFLGRSVLNLLLMSGANLSATKVDARDLEKIFSPLKKSGLISIHVIFISENHHDFGFSLFDFTNSGKVNKNQLRTWLAEEDYTEQKCLEVEETCLVFQKKSGFKNAAPVLLTRLEFSKSQILEPLLKLRYSLIGTIALALVLILVLAVLLSIMITRPVSRLEEATQQIALGNLEYQIEIKGNDEFSHLAKSFNAMSNSLTLHIRELAEKYEELNAARIIQQSLLPERLPRPASFTFAANFTPMAEVGGDIFDITKTDNGYGVLVADVSGHGVPAALITTMTKVIVAGRKDLAEHPAQMVAWLNHSLCGQTGNRFVTLIYGFLNLQQSSFTFANAGHPEIYKLNRNNSNIDGFNAKGSMVGLFPDLKFAENSISLEKGDRLVLYTDGITECHSPEGVMYESDRFKDFLLQHADLSADAVCIKLIDSLMVYHGNLPNLEDDATILIIDKD